jgi:hypothetical protein
MTRPRAAQWRRSEGGGVPPVARRIVVAVLVEVALAFLLSRLVGTPLLWSALLALPIAAVLLLLLTTPPGVEPTWAEPPAPPSAATHLEASTLAGRLADAATDTSRFRSRIQPRLAALALATLRRRPALRDLPDLADPRAAEALGPRLHDLLTDPRATLPDPDVLLGLFDRLEEQ